MSRPPVLPLPDAVASKILRGIDDLRNEYPISLGTRPFVGAFIRLVYEASGDVYGAKTYRELLKSYAPEYKPSTTTVHDEKKRFEDDLRQVTEKTEPPGWKAQEPMAQYPITGALSERSVGGQNREAFAVDVALIRTLEEENSRLRRQAESLKNELSTATAELNELINQQSRLQSERNMAQAHAQELIERIGELAAAVQRADEQVQASHRFAMGRIENATAEVRLWKDQLAAMEGKYAALEKKLRDEQQLSDTYRRALTEARNSS